MSNDRSWMENRVDAITHKLTTEYEQGVEQFLQFAFDHPSFVDNGTIRCPCNQCRNIYWKLPEIVRIHLYRKGFVRGYSKWTYHGEPITEESSRYPDSQEAQDGSHIYEYHNMVIDAAGPDICWDDDMMEDEPNVRAQQFYQLLKDADEPLYENYEGHSKLSAVTTLLHFKSESGCSEQHFNELLEFIDEILPKGHKLPTSFYQVKKVVRALGLGYEKIDAYENDCILYYQENKDLSECPKCHSPRYEEHSGEGKGKRIPRKILRYFPLAPRLMRLYMSSKTAEHMRWHSTCKKVDGEMRHPSDGEAWKRFDELHESFAKETRNVRLGLATDGFNPYGVSSNPHSTWPVIIVPYNLPPYMCMKEPYMFLSLLIPGPKSPGRDIDVYMRPLIDELKMLWYTGVETYDVSLKQNFQMKAALMWTINDFPAYAMMEGWSVHGSMACPVCKDENCAIRLKHSGKYSYFGCERRFLPIDHPLRKQKDKFDNTVEKRLPPTLLDGYDCDAWTDAIEFPSFGKDFKNQRADGFGKKHNWTKRSIFFELPYWSSNLLRHNLDVMHIEKNVFDNVFNTVMNVKGKSKDHVKARRDLEDMNIRHELHPLSTNGSKTTYPRACFTLDKDQIRQVCEWVKQLKLPDGYASNISRCCNLSECKFYGMKSHDCHVFMQKLIPVAFRDLLDKRIVDALTDLSHFFRDLCCTVLKKSDMEVMEKKIVETIGNLGKIFPPSFFDVMEHLPIHLPYEAKVGGPVQYRWMYPFERCMGRFKGKVRNKARPEGSIAEAYIIDELVNFCSLYFDVNKLTKHNRLGRNEDANDVDDDECLEIFKQTGRVFRKAEKHGRNLSDEEYSAAHLYALLNCPEVEPYVIEFDEEAVANNPTLTDEKLENLRTQLFSSWFKTRVGREKTIDPRLIHMSRGPLKWVQSFKGYIVNGFRFHTVDVENCRKTQNSGVCIKGSCYNDSETNFYGRLVDIIELSYPNMNHVVMFKCDWYDISKGVKVDHKGIVQVNLKSRFNKYEPFVLASQATQVFYAKGVSRKHQNWHTVIKIRARSSYDMAEDGNTHSTVEETYQEDEIDQVTSIGMNDDVDGVSLRQDGTIEEDEEDATKAVQSTNEEDSEDDVEDEDGDIHEFDQGDESEFHIDDDE